MADRHHTPEYRAAKHRLGQEIRAGYGWCTQPVCVMDSRFIPPTTSSREWHVAHDDTGTVILGAAHQLCNVTDGGKRRHLLHPSAAPDRWIL